jgi:hypothetical protein
VFIFCVMKFIAGQRGFGMSSAIDYVYLFLSLPGKRLKQNGRERSSSLHSNVLNHHFTMRFGPLTPTVTLETKLPKRDDS